MTNTIHPLFPTAIYQCKIEGHSEWKESLMSKKDYMFDPDDGEPFLTGEGRGKCLMHKDEDLMSFFAELTIVVRDAMRSIGIKDEMFIPYFMKSWFTIKNYTETLSVHSHACADLSFVYYLSPGTLYFQQDSNPNEYFHGIYDPKPSDRSLIKEQNFFNSSYCNVDAEEGDLLIFPSKLKHFVVPERGDGSYVRSVAGDIKLVLKEEYTHLETGLIHHNHWRSFG